MTDLQAQLDRLRTIQALRFTVLCLAIFVAAALLGLSTGIVSLVPAIVLVLFLKDERFATGLGMLAGVLFGGICVLIISYFFARIPLLFMITCLIVIFILSYIVAQSIQGRSNLLAFAVSAELCLLTALFAEVSGAGEGVAAVRLWLIELPVGMLLLWIILIGLWPSPTARDIDAVVLATRRQCAGLLRQTVEPVRSGIATSYAPSRVSLRFLGELTRTVNLNAAKFRNEPISVEFMHSRLDSLSQIYANIRYMQRAFEDLPEPGLSPEARVAAADIMAAFADRIDGSSSAHPDAAFETIACEEQRHVTQPAEDLASMRLAARLSGFVVAAHALDKSIAAYDRPEPLPTAKPTAKAADTAAPHLMIDSLQTAIKIVLGVLAGLLIFMVSGLPTSAYLVVAILVVLVQPNLGRAHLRLRLWFPGVLFGSLWAIAGLMVLSLLPHFAVYLVWLLPGLLLAGYLGLGPDRIAYVGIQIAAAIAVILGMAVYPADNVISAETRILGAVIGFLVSLSIYHFVWPTHPAALLRQSLCRNLRDMADVLSSICAVESDQRDLPAEAILSQRVAELKLQVQANVGLLDDISYLLTSRVRPAYRYQILCLQLGFVCAQVWCLQNALSAIDDIDRRRAIQSPIAAAAPRLLQVFGELADRLDHGHGASSEEIGKHIEAIRSQLGPYRNEVASEVDRQRREDMQYGINAVGIMAYHLKIFADGMKFPETVGPLRTAELEHLCEASDS